jgi:hypothetical protein
MADRRRAEDTPLAPHRSLSGPSNSGDSRAGDSNGDPGKRPIGERVSSAVSAAGSAVSSAASSASAAAKSSGDSGPATSSGSSRPVAKKSTRPRGPRRARLRLVHLDPWSVMKTAFLLSIAIGIVTVVSVFVVWSVLGAAGVWDSINKTVADVVGGDQAQSFDVENYVGMSRVLGFTMIVSVVDVVLVTAIATLGAFLYNLAAALLGGIEVTLAEDDR